jgi:hypothetical protein
MQEHEIEALLNLLQYVKSDLSGKRGVTVGELFAKGKVRPQKTDSLDEPRYLEKLQAALVNEEFANLTTLGSTSIYANPDTGEPYPAEGFKGTFYGNLKTGEIYFAMRGTAEGEWYDNSIAACNKDSPQLEEALRFFDSYLPRIVRNFKRRKTYEAENVSVIITGHSKGGNKAQYLHMMTRHERFPMRTVSMDGQNASPEAMKSMIDRLGWEKFVQRSSQIKAVNCANDYVNPLIHNRGDIPYKGKTLPPSLVTKAKTDYHRFNPDVARKSLDKLPNQHMPDAYLSREGNLTEKTRQGFLSRVVERASDHISAKDPATRRLISDSIMWLLQRKQPLGEEKRLSKWPLRFGLFLALSPLWKSVRECLSEDKQKARGQKVLKVAEAVASRVDERLSKREVPQEAAVEMAQTKTSTEPREVARAKTQVTTESGEKEMIRSEVKTSSETEVPEISKTITKEPAEPKLSSRRGRTRQRETGMEM